MTDGQRVVLALWAFATALTLLAIGGPLRALRRRLSAPQTAQEPSDEALVETQLRLETDYAALRANNGAAVDLLYAEAKGGYDLARDRNKVLEGKAGTLITIVTTGFGAIALIGDPSKAIARNGPVITALTALALAFCAALGAVVPRRTDYPELSVYASAATVADRDNTTRIKFDLIGSWLAGMQRNNVSARDKGRLLMAAILLLGFGLGALAYNFVIAQPPSQLVPTIRVILSPQPSPSAAAPARPARPPASSRKKP